MQRDGAACFVGVFDARAETCFPAIELLAHQHVECGGLPPLFVGGAASSTSRLPWNRSSARIHVLTALAICPKLLELSHVRWLASDALAFDRGDSPRRWRVTRQLFHEFTGALFAVFAAYGGFIVWKEWKHRPAVWIMGFVVIYVLMMAVFAFTAFRRARRVR